MTIGDGRKTEVEFFGCIDVVMFCDEDVEMTVGHLAFVAGVPIDLDHLT